MHNALQESESQATEVERTLQNIKYEENGQRYLDRRKMISTCEKECQGITRRPACDVQLGFIRKKRPITVIQLGEDYSQSNEISTLYRETVGLWFSDTRKEIVIPLQAEIIHKMGVKT